MAWALLKAHEGDWAPPDQVSVCLVSIFYPPYHGNTVVYSGLVFSLQRGRIARCGSQDILVV